MWWHTQVYSPLRLEHRVMEVSLENTLENKEERLLSDSVPSEICEADTCCPYRWLLTYLYTHRICKHCIQLNKWALRSLPTQETEVKEQKGRISGSLNMFAATQLKDHFGILNTLVTLQGTITPLIHCQQCNCQATCHLPQPGTSWGAEKQVHNSCFYSGKPHQFRQTWPLIGNSLIYPLTPSEYFPQCSLSICREK